MMPPSHLPQLRIAVIEPNVLACMGLQCLLTELFPMVETVVCESFDELRQHAGATFVHYFVSSRIYFEHAPYFRSCSGRCIVMVSGDMSINGVATLNVCQGQADLMADLMRLKHEGHRRYVHAGVATNGGHSTDIATQPTSSRDKVECLLSPREVEVALLLCRGCINKEVADKLGIGLTTVITHRKNIMEKLKAKSLADVIVYCVMNGIYAV